MNELWLPSENPRKCAQIVEDLLGTRLDAVETAAFARELEHVMARTFDMEYPGLMARKLIPISFEAGPWADTVTYQRWDWAGEAKIVTNFGDDLPLADVSAREFSSPVITLGTGFHYTTKDLRRSTKLRRPLPTQRGRAARGAAERTANRIALLGDPETNTPGFAKNANVEVVSVVTGAWTVSTTADQMFGDLFKLLLTPRTATKLERTPNTLALGTDEYNLAAIKHVDATNKTTVLDQLKKTWRDAFNVELAIFADPLLDTANATNNGPRAVAYDRSDDVLFWHICMEFTTHPPQARNLAFLIPCEMVIGGVDMPRPEAVAYMDGL